LSPGIHIRRWGSVHTDIILGGRSINSRTILWLICVLYMVMSAMYGSINLDVDELSFVKEPYELLGGDYTLGYLKAHDFAGAASVAARSYYFYWTYRPLNAPIISEEHRKLFAGEEARFGYVKPEKVEKGDPDSYAKYAKRLIVPEPDRFYNHGAGKPLLPAILSIPQLALVRLLTPGENNLLHLQYTVNYHPVFILVRLAQMLSGLLTILIVFRILSREYSAGRALFGAAVFAFLPACIRYFPNLHHDPIAVPFVLLSAYCYTREKYKMAGAFLGLAMAAKNTAIILGAAYLALSLWEMWQARSSPASGAAPASLSGRMKGLVTVGVFGLLFLLPFANPVSFTSEILTPITHRAYDSRGEDVKAFTLTSRGNPTAGNAEATKMSPGLRVTEWVLRLEEVGFFFLTLAVFQLLARRGTPLTRISILILLLVLPYGLVFGYGLGYRILMFVPFFAVLCADVAPRKLALGFVVLLLAVDALYCIDPITTNAIHLPVNDETFWSACSRWISLR
jgi:hypothetical protein